MILTADHPDAETTIVMLNDKPVKLWLSAEEGDPGWIEVLDIAAMAPIKLQADAYEDWEPEFQEQVTKKIEGKVEFIKIKR